jgi:hypothetical protein
MGLTLFVSLLLNVLMFVCFFYIFLENKKEKQKPKRQTRSRKKSEIKNEVVVELNESPSKRTEILKELQILKSKKVKSQKDKEAIYTLEKILPNLI